MGFLPNMYFVHPEVTNLLDAVDFSFIFLIIANSINKLSKGPDRICVVFFCTFDSYLPKLSVQLTFGSDRQGILEVAGLYGKKMSQTWCIWFPSQVEKGQDISAWFGSVRFGLVWSCEFHSASFVTNY